MEASTNAPDGGQESGSRWRDWLSKLQTGCVRLCLRWCAPEVLSEIYRGLLQRDPDPEGVATYREEMRAGGLAAVLRSILGSEEFRRRSFSAHAPEMVEAVYRALLGREPDPEGRRIYTDLLAAKGDFAVFAADLVASDEFNEASFAKFAPEMVKAAYRGILGRAASQAELAASTRSLVADRDFASICGELAGLPEFLRNHRRRHVFPAVIDAVYHALLDREPDAAGQQTYTALLEEKEDFAPFVSAVANGEECRQRSFARLAAGMVNAAYEGILGRMADPAELAGRAPRLAAPQDWAPLLSELSNSVQRRQQELARLAPGLVNSLYRGLQGREATQSEQDAHVRIAGTEAGAEKIAQTLVESEEFRRAVAERNLTPQGIDQPLTPALVRLGFLYVLGRPGTDKDVSAHVALGKVGALRLTLVRSMEFRQLWSALIPMPHPAPGDATKPKTILLHIPKTGGTTLNDALTPFFAPGAICPERFNSLHQYTSGSLARYEFFSGHFTLESCGLIPGPQRIVTMLRQPLDRLVSLYNFARAHDDDVIKERGLWLASLARRHDLPDLFALGEVRNHPSINNAMVRILASALPAARWEAAAKVDPDADPATDLLPLAKQHLRSLLAFGIMERYQESVDWIFHMLGLLSPTTVRPKMVLKDLAGKAAGFKLMEPQTCGPAALGVLKPLIEADLALYEYALELFDEKITAWRGVETQDRAATTRQGIPSNRRPRPAAKQKPRAAPRAPL